MIRPDATTIPASGKRAATSLGEVDTCQTTGHLDVGKQVDGPFVHFVQRLVCRTRFDDLEACIFKSVRHGQPDQNFVLDHEYCACPTPCMWRDNRTMRLSFQKKVVSRNYFQPGIE